MTWTPPGYVASGEADSGKFNIETVDNLQHLHDLLGGLRIEAGTFTATFAAIDAVNQPMSFATPFAATPIVVVTASTVLGEEIVVNVSSVATTGMTVRVGVADGSAISTTVTLRYIAIGTPA